MPDTLSLLFLALQHLSAATKFTIAGKLVRERLAERYPFFTAGLIVSASMQAWMLSGLWLNPTAATQQAAYQHAWRIATPFQIAASLAMAVEALWVMARHYPKARNLMLITVTLCAIASAAVLLPYLYAAPTVKARAAWKIVLLVVVVVARVLLVEKGPGMSQNARLHSFAVALAMGGSVLGDWVGAASRAYAVQALSKAILIGVPLAACRWWWQMRPAGEAFTPTPGPSLEDLEPETRRIERAIGKAAGRE
jgi:hypothetical protein